MSGRSKNHTLKGGMSPYSLSMGVPPPGFKDFEKLLNRGVKINGDWEQNIKEKRGK